MFGAAAAHGLELPTAGAPLLVVLPVLCQSEGVLCSRLGERLLGA